MLRDFKNIHIGTVISERVKEIDIDIVRICNFLHCTEEMVEKMYQSESMDSVVLLRWSKLLEYDFFRLFTQHLILYAPPSNIPVAKKRSYVLPQFRKNIYTQEVIYFIIELIKNKKKTKLQVIEEYGIPKTTLYKWIEKYGK